MNEEVPAWKAVLDETLDKRFPFPSFVADRDEIREFVADQIRAAEERGRREALKAASQRLREFVGPKKAYPGEADRIKRYVLGWHDAADLIDPEVP